MTVGSGRVGRGRRPVAARQRVHAAQLLHPLFAPLALARLSQRYGARDRLVGRDTARPEARADSGRRAHAGACPGARAASDAYRERVLAYGRFGASDASEWAAERADAADAGGGGGTEARCGGARDEPLAAQLVLAAVLARGLAAARSWHRAVRRDTVQFALMHLCEPRRLGPSFAHRKHRVAVRLGLLLLVCASYSVLSDRRVAERLIGARELFRETRLVHSDSVH